jgi:hypothetical protein
MLTGGGSRHSAAILDRLKGQVARRLLPDNGSKKIGGDPYAVEGVMLLQPRRRWLALPARFARARTAYSSRRNGKPPVWWHLAGAGLLALAVTGGLAAVSRGGTERSSETAHRAAGPSGSANTQAQAPSKTERSAPVVAATPSQPPAPRQSVDPAGSPAQATLRPAPAGAPPSLPTPAPNGPAPPLGSPFAASSQRAAPALTPSDPIGAAAPRQASVVDPRSAPTASAEARPGSKPSAYEEQIAKGAIVAPSQAPAECLPSALRSVLADVASRYGPLTIVSTQHLNTRNHGAGSARHKLHQACKAVDFSVASQRADEVKTYLRSRPEVGGLEAYRDEVIHIDLNENRTAAQVRPRPETPAAPR